MPKKPQQKETGENRADRKSGKQSAEQLKPREQGNWSEDQKSKSYYYDDAYGYEVYNPDDDEDKEISD